MLLSFGEKWSLLWIKHMLLPHSKHQPLLTLLTLPGYCIQHEQLTVLTWSMPVQIYNTHLVAFRQTLTIKTLRFSIYSPTIQYGTTHAASGLVNINPSMNNHHTLPNRLQVDKSLHITSIRTPYSAPHSLLVARYSSIPLVGMSHQFGMMLELVYCMLHDSARLRIWQTPTNLATWIPVVCWPSWVVYKKGANISFPILKLTLIFGPTSLALWEASHSSD